MIANLLLRRGAGPQLDPTDARANAPVTGNQRDADLTAPFDMSPTAELTGPIAEGDDPNQIAVLLVEQRHRAGGNRLVQRKLLDTPDKVCANLLVQQRGDPVDLVHGQRARETEVERRGLGLNR